VDEILALVEETNWLTQTRQLLFNAFCIAGLLMRGESVIIQTTLPCKRLRTTSSSVLGLGSGSSSSANAGPFMPISSEALLNSSVLVCLSLLVSDPHVRSYAPSQLQLHFHAPADLTILSVCGVQYRTIAGFRALVWREFVRVHTDILCYEGSRPVGATLPATYIVFLDCVWQVMQVHPRAFEFGEAFLEAEFTSYLQGHLASQLKVSSASVPPRLLNPLYLAHVRLASCHVFAFNHLSYREFV